MQLEFFVSVKIFFKFDFSKKEILDFEIWKFFKKIFLSIKFYSNFIICTKFSTLKCKFFFRFLNCTVSPLKDLPGKLSRCFFYKFYLFIFSLYSTFHKIEFFIIFFRLFCYNSNHFGTFFKNIWLIIFGKKIFKNFPKGWKKYFFISLKTKIFLYFCLNKNHIKSHEIKKNGKSWLMLKKMKNDDNVFFSFFSYSFFCFPRDFPKKKIVSFFLYNFHFVFVWGKITFFSFFFIIYLFF